MKIKFYKYGGKITAGMTLRDPEEPESGNMALHACVSPAAILENRKKLAALLDCEPGCFVCPNQTHSSNYYKATSLDKGRGAYETSAAIPDTDAVFTFEPDLLLCCFTADCVPVLFYNEPSGLVGAIHSGWKGTVGEITRKVFRHLIEQGHCEPGDFRVSIGKALSKEKFEVDEDVFQRFHALGYGEQFLSYNGETKKHHIDNRQVVKKQCELEGIPARQVILEPGCTYLDPDGFSYRRDKQSGRHMSFIIRKGGQV